MKIPFDPKEDTHYNMYTHNNGTFTVPKTGLYRVSAETYHTVNTGRFELQENFGRRWYQFWKPKLVMREVVEVVKVPCGMEVKHLNAGQEVSMAVIERIGGIDGC
jgi:hypothetical protein